MNRNLFHQQADLLISLLPNITKESDFALHGGTAINLFVRDMPRISVDIDLIYLYITSRDETLKQISEKLNVLAEQISDTLPDVRVEMKTGAKGSLVTKLFVKRNNVSVKVELSQVIRGAIFDCEDRDLCKKAEDTFEKFVTTRTMSFAELYGSKIRVALDRRHPRDIFDIMLLLKNEGITNEVRKVSWFT